MSIAVFCFLSVIADPVSAQDRIIVEIGKSAPLTMAGEIGTVFVSDPTIADASVSSDNRVFVFGKTVGETTFNATMLNGGSDVSIVVVVTHRLSEIRSVLNTRFPGEQVSVESSRGSLLVTGRVSSEAVRETVLTTLRSGSPDTVVIDRLSVGDSNIVRLQVLLLEVSRTQIESFGIDWTATVAENGFFLGTSNRGVIGVGNSSGAETSLSAAVDLLVSSGIATVAQETVLSTVMGETAELSVGTEIPVPSAISNEDGTGSPNYQLDYKLIGTSLEFTPSMAPGNKLRLLVNSTVSTEGDRISTVNGNEFPNINSRTFRTTVELDDRQPLVIAGVSRNNTTADLRNSRDGVLSRSVDTLFGADSISNSSQELVVIITPLFAENDPVSIRELLPDAVGNLEFIFSGSGRGAGSRSDARVFGPAGFRY